MPIYRLRQFFPFFLLTTFSFLSFACSGEGPEVVDPAADERNETALLAVDKGGIGELAHYYEVDGIVDQSEYRTVNGEDLTVPVDAVYEAYENVYLHSNAAGQIVVLNLNTREKVGLIAGLPTPDSTTAGGKGTLCGMAFSNLSQGWVIAYGSPYLYLIDARNFVLVRSIPLPGNPTTVTTIDNRVFVTVENADGTGSICMTHSNDPDFNVEIKAQLPRPAFFTEVNPDGQDLIVLIPGLAEDDPTTNEIDTDPRLFVFSLLDYSTAYDQPFFAPSMREYIGKQPNFADLSKDFYLYLATSDGVKRLDTKSWGSITHFLGEGGYNVVSVDYWTDLVYAVSTSAPNVVERKTKRGQILSSFALDNPIRSIRFVSTSKVGSR